LSCEGQTNFCTTFAEENCHDGSDPNAQKACIFPGSENEETGNRLLRGGEAGVQEETLRLYSLFVDGHMTKKELEEKAEYHEKIADKLENE